MSNNKQTAAPAATSNEKAENGAEKEAIEKFVEVVRNTPELQGEMFFDGCIIAMTKDAFKGKYRVFYGNGLHTSIMFGAGTAALDLMTPGSFLPPFPQRLIKSREGSAPTMEATDPMMSRVIILMNGECLDVNSELINRPKTMGDDAISNLTDDLNNITPKEGEATVKEWDSLPGGELRYLSKANKPDETYMKDLIEKYFEKAICHNGKKVEDYVFFLVANPIAMVSLARKGFMSNVNMHNYESFENNIVIPADDDELYFGDHTFKVAVNNERLNTSSVANCNAYVRPFFHGCNGFYQGRNKRIYPESHDLYRRDYIKDYNTDYKSLCYSRKTENVMPVCDFISSTAATLVLQKFPLNYVIEHKFTTEDDDYKTKMAMSVKLDLIKEIAIKNRYRPNVFDDNFHVSQDRIYATKYQGHLERNTISPNALHTYKTGGKLGIAGELMEGEKMSQWVHTDIASKFTSMENFNKNGGDEAALCDDEEKELGFGKMYVTSRLSSVFDFKSIFNANRMTTQHELSSQLGDTDTKKEQKEKRSKQGGSKLFNYKIKSAFNPVFNSLKSPAQKILFNMCGDRTLFKSVMEDALFLLRDEIFLEDKLVITHPAFAESENPNHCQYCKCSFNNGMAGVENKDFCFCYLILRTMCALSAREPTQFNITNLWDKTAFPSELPPTTTETFDYNFNMNVRTIERKNKCSAYGNAVLTDSERENGFADPNLKEENGSKKKLQSYMKEVKLEALIKAVLTAEPTLLHPDQRINMDKITEGDEFYHKLEANRFAKSMGYKQDFTMGSIGPDETPNGSYQLSSIKSIRDVLLKDSKSSVDYELNKFIVVPGKMTHTIKGTKKSDDGDSKTDGSGDMEDDFTSLAKMTNRKRKAGGKDGPSKKKKKDGADKSLEKLARAMLLDLLEISIPNSDASLSLEEQNQEIRKFWREKQIHPDYIFLFPNAEEKRKLTPETTKQLCQKFMKVVGICRDMIRPEPTSSENIRLKLVTTYMAGVRDYIKRLAEFLAKKLNYSSVEEMRGYAMSSIRMKNESVKKTQSSWMDPQSTSDPVQKMMERKITSAYATHRIESANTKVLPYTDSKLIPVCSEIPIPARMILCSVGETESDGCKRLGYNIEGYKRNEKDIKMAGEKQQPHSYLTPLEMKIKMDTFQKEAENIEKEKYVDGNKPETAAREEIFKQVREKEINCGVYIPWEIMAKDLCENAGYKDSDVLDPAVLAHILKRADVKFEKLGNGGFASALNCKTIAKLLAGYLDTMEDVNVTRPSLITNIFSDMDTICSMVNKIGMNMKSFFGSYDYATFDMATFNLKDTLLKMISQEPELGSVLHLLITMATIYGVNTSTNGKLFYKSYERDSQAAVVGIGGILNIFLGMDACKSSNAAREIKQAQRKINPMITTHMDYNMKRGGGIDRWSTLDTAKCQGMSRYLGCYSFSTYPGQQGSNDIYTKLKLSGGFFYNSIPAHICAQSKSHNTNKVTMCLKNSGVLYSSFKRGGRNVDIAELLNRGDLDDINNTILSTNGLAQKIAAYFLSSIGIEPKTNGFPDMGNMSKSMFVRKIVKIHFSEFAEEDGEIMVERKVLKHILGFVYPDDSVVEKPDMFMVYDPSAMDVDEDEDEDMDDESDDESDGEEMSGE